MKIYDVHTDLPMDMLTEVAKETFRLWLQFALGQEAILGRKLERPTGRYAASLSWKPTGPDSVMVVADEAIAPEAERVEDGTQKGADMKKMLARNAKISATGEAYRVIPLRPDNPEGPLKFNIADIVVRGPGGKGGRVKASVRKIWATPRPFVDPQSKYRTITESSPGWQVPAMTAYAPGLALSQMLQEKYGK